MRTSSDCHGRRRSYTPKRWKTIPGSLRPAPLWRKHGWIWISPGAQPFPGRRGFLEAVTCFEAAGDLDGVAQSWYDYARSEYGKGDHSGAYVEMAQRAASIAQSTGNIEQEILSAALLGNMMLEFGDDDAAYTAFSRGMQIADRNGLGFFSAQLLNARA